ncbi:MAG: sigma-70 family RNA polymerase sigma factor [Verrucomicrobia bacterium]|nr:sigma-70 family RNA polymerase sigma factor [Verrucomicrobiota bacterium]
MAAGRADSSQGANALEQLCRTYWYPLYVYVRRQGRDPHEAQDLTREFFARLLAAKSIQFVDRSKGKFRSFLLTSMNHFLAKEWNRAHRQKRGGGRVIVSLDDDTAERRYLCEPADQLTADKLFDRRWALTVLEQAMERLKTEFTRSGKVELFEQLKASISGDPTAAPYAEVAAKCQMTEGAVKVAMHRLRKHFGELLRDEIAQTVSRPEEVEAEIRHLFEALRGSMP